MLGRAEAAFIPNSGFLRHLLTCCEDVVPSKVVGDTKHEVGDVRPNAFPTLAATFLAQVVTHAVDSAIALRLSGTEDPSSTNGLLDSVG
jgi:hypothetical protein